MNPTPTDQTPVQKDRPEEGVDRNQGAGKRIKQLMSERGDLRNQVTQKDEEITALKAELERWQRSAAEQQQAAEIDAREREQLFAAGLEEMRSQFPDFDDVVGSLRSLPPEVLSTIQEESCGPLLLYRMGKFPPLHYELVSVTIQAARKRIRRLCVELEQELERQARRSDVDRWYRGASREHLSRRGAN